MARRADVARETMQGHAARRCAQVARTHGRGHASPRRHSGGATWQGRLAGEGPTG